MKSNLIQKTHPFKGYEVTLSRFENAAFFHSYEVADKETEGLKYYVEGILRIEKDILLDYDGASCLPRAVAFALHEEGIGFAPYILPDSLFA